jgi:hypothetical protein
VQQLRQQAAQNGGGGAGAGGTKSGAAAGGAGATAPAAPAAPAAPPPAPTAWRMQTNAPANQAVGTFTVTNLPTSLAGQPMGIEDIILQNPNGDTGVLQIRKKNGSTDTVLLAVGLENFRDLDYHLLQSWQMTKDDHLEIAVSCQNGTGKPNAGACSSAVSFSGLVG